MAGKFKRSVVELNARGGDRPPGSVGRPVSDATAYW